MDVGDGEEKHHERTSNIRKYRGQGRPFFSYVIDEIIYKNN
jgi:hypothetical protein